MKEKSVNLTVYAKQYDNMTKFKPSYHEVMQTVVDSIGKYLDTNSPFVVGDFGAGTGELTKRLAESYPHARIHSVERNDAFFEKLDSKTGTYKNVRTLLGDIEKQNFPSHFFDAIAMIHVLNYTLHAKEGTAIRVAYDQLKAGGIIVIADIGRELDMRKHRKETLIAAYSELGLLKTILLYLRSNQVVKQNRIFRQNQKKGIHPMHSLNEFVQLIEHYGLVILEKRDDLYLGSDDFVVARKPR